MKQTLEEQIEVEIAVTADDVRDIVLMESYDVSPIVFVIFTAS